MRSGSKWVLVVSDGDDEDRIVPVPAEGVLTVGRSAESGLQLTAAGVSRRHAVLETNQGQLVLADCGATNGTFVGGQRLTSPRPLRTGETLSLGNARIRVVSIDDARPMTAEIPTISPRPAKPMEIRGTKGPVHTGSGAQNHVGHGTINAAEGHGIVSNDNRTQYRAERDGYFAGQQHFNDNSNYVDFEFPEITSLRRGGFWGVITIAGLITLGVGVCIVAVCVIIGVSKPIDCTGLPKCQTYVFPVINGMQVLILGIATALAGGMVYAAGAVGGSAAAAREKELERRSNRRNGRSW